MKPIRIITLLMPICFFTWNVKAQSKSKERPCALDYECCKKDAYKKTAKTNTANMISPVKKDKVVACKLTSAELQKRKAQLIALLKAHILEREEITNGYQYTFKGSENMLDHIVNFIKAERACCPFFTFNLSVEDVQTNIHLAITGPEGAKEFINADMEL